MGANPTRSKALSYGIHYTDVDHKKIKSLRSIIMGLQYYMNHQDIFQVIGIMASLKEF